MNKRLTQEIYFVFDQTEYDGRIWSSYKGCIVDALALEAEEGRDKLR